MGRLNTLHLGRGCNWICTEVLWDSLVPEDTWDWLYNLNNLNWEIRWGQILIFGGIEPCLPYEYLWAMGPDRAFDSHHFVTGSSRHSWYRFGKGCYAHQLRQELVLVKRHTAKEWESLAIHIFRYPEACESFGLNLGGLRFIFLGIPSDMST